MSAKRHYLRPDGFCADCGLLEPKGACPSIIKSDRPEVGKVYSLIGGADQPSIARGDSWKASEVQKKTEVGLNEAGRFFLYGDAATA